MASAIAAQVTPARAQLADDGQASAHGAGDAGGFAADAGNRPLGLGTLGIPGQALGIEALGIGGMPPALGAGRLTAPWLPGIARAASLCR